MINTVRDLRVHLQAFDPDAPVIVQIGDIRYGNPDVMQNDDGTVVVGYQECYT